MTYIVCTDLNGGSATVNSVWQCERDPKNIMPKPIGVIVDEVQKLIPGSKDLHFLYNNQIVCFKLSMIEIMQQARSLDFVYTKNGQKVKGKCTLSKQ
ncbi:hypothetical protein GGI07_000379 [Coemansia sp. Benny D115]|nr:hypothetical protein GGI07_000379 [Coemansia sp. Benny D115]